MSTSLKRKVEEFVRGYCTESRKDDLVEYIHLMLESAYDDKKKQTEEQKRRDKEKRHALGFAKSVYNFLENDDKRIPAPTFNNIVVEELKMEGGYFVDGWEYFEGGEEPDDIYRYKCVVSWEKGMRLCIDMHFTQYLYVVETNCDEIKWAGDDVEKKSFVFDMKPVERDGPYPDTNKMICESVVDFLNENTFFNSQWLGGRQSSIQLLCDM